MYFCEREKQSYVRTWLAFVFLYISFLQSHASFSKCVYRSVSVLDIRKKHSPNPFVLQVTKNLQGQFKSLVNYYMIKLSADSDEMIVLSCYATH